MSTATQGRALRTGHVGLNVSEIGRSGEFYREAFGLEVVAESREEGREFVFLGRDGELLLTLWQQSEGLFETARPGLHHLSFEVGSVEEVREHEERLRGLGARFLYEGVVPHGEGADSGGVFFEDPHGIRLEIYSPTGAGEAQAPVSDVPSCGFF